MENEPPLEQVSRSTSPTFPKSTTSGTTPAADSHSDTNSVTSAETASVTTAYIVPAPPANTPATQSVVDGMTNLNLAEARDALAALSGAVTLGTSELSNASSDPTSGAKEGVDANGKDTEDGADTESRATTPTQKTNNGGITPPNERVHEHSKWEEVAREDLMRALGRAAQYAEDCYKTDHSRSMEDYYSELVADVINAGDLKFDASYLE